MRCCIFPGATARETGFSADVNWSAKQRAGSNDHGSRAKASSLEGLHAQYTFSIAGKQKPADGSLYGTQASMLLKEGPYCAPVEPAIALSAWRPYCRALT